MGNKIKEFKSYAEQVERLRSRGMDLGDYSLAIETLQRVNYYRLSGYWYPFRQQSDNEREDHFYEGTRFQDVVSLYEFDERLRAATFAALMPIELAIRATLGHELGRIDPCAHLDITRLGASARSGDRYQRWRERYEFELSQSREDFVKHHKENYDGVLPVWAAVEVLDWGGLTYLFGFAPRKVQDAVADVCELTAPQLASWLKALNIVRNICAHNGRLFNRVHALSPKLPVVGRHPDLDAATHDWGRTFAQLTLIQFLSDRLKVGKPRLLPAVVKSYPNVQFVPISHLGAPANWKESSRLWAQPS